MQTIYYGAPGTGKSHQIDQYIIKNVPEEQIFRVTFYPDFSYGDFVGQLIPVVIPSTTGGASTITYNFEKGIFTMALERAYEDLNKDVYLIIEEMSRGDCAAIFGDIFQLLDRFNSGVNKGFSKYSIDNKMISKDIVAHIGSKVKLPPNFHILGTVNTSDQNVFVMDTAFKRRFEWEYVSTAPVKDSSGIYINNVNLKFNDGSIMRDVQWIDLFTKLNNFIVNDNFLGLGEDKQIGQFFIEFDLNAPYAEHKRKIKNKLLHYLWSDVHKASFKNDISLFNPSLASFSELYTAYDTDKVIFSEEFLSTL